MELKNKVIVFFGNIRFGSDIKATSLFMAENLAKHNKVYFIEYPYTLKDYVQYRDSDEVQKRKSKFSLASDGLMDTDNPNLKIVVIPPTLPINFLPEGLIFRSMLGMNELIIVSRLKKIFKREGIKDFIYINSFNFHYPNVASKIKPTLTVYQCVDPMIIPYDMKHGIRSENQLIKESDLVVCTSRALYNEKKKQNRNTYFVPNATDGQHFNYKADTDLPVHEKIKHLAKPIIGYIGSVERRIDYDLILKVATANPNKNFVLAGPVWHEYIPEAFQKLSNVHIIGAIDYAEVPQMLHSFDVAIIPFKKDEVSQTIFPLKLFEYLSEGKPVILTDFNMDLEEFTGDTVTYCGNAESFSKAIDEALNENSAAKVKSRLDVAKMNTWQIRAEQVASIINSHLPATA